MPTIYQIIVISLLSAFVILVMNKSEVRDKLRDYNCRIANFKIAKMLECDFCLGFWVAIVIAAILSIFTLNASWIFVPVMSAPITRFLV